LLFLNENPKILVHSRGYKLDERHLLGINVLQNLLELQEVLVKVITGLLSLIQVRLDQVESRESIYQIAKTGIGLHCQFDLIREVQNSLEDLF
jgi:hypothetical protein